MKLLDDNDSPPVFSQSHYSFLVPEGNPFGLRLGAVAATDADDALNANVNYRLELPRGTILAMDQIPKS